MILAGSKSSELMREEIAHSLPLWMMNTLMAGNPLYQLTTELNGGK